MATNKVTVEIKKIPVTAEIEDLGQMEAVELAAQVETEMRRVLETGVIDTLKQALTAALVFAARAYLKEQAAGGRKQADAARMDSLINKLKNTLESTK